MIIGNKFSGYSRDNIRTYPQGGGSPAPTQSTNTASTLPAYAQPYMEDLMGKAQALTSAPYQTYGGDRIAGQTPLQQQAAATTASVDPSAAGFQANVGSFMDPYQQNVTDIAKREATRTSDIAGQADQAKAAQAGAFGGYRQGIQNSERERNLDQQLNDIQMKGSSQAFNNATNQFNTSNSQQLQAAGQQNSIGTQQQQQQQDMLSQQYQDFLNQQNMPYKQLGFMSDIMHGVPGTSSASQVYQAPPSTLSQVAGLGMAGAGIMKAMKKGGVVKTKKPSGLAELALHKMGA